MKDRKPSRVEGFSLYLAQGQPESGLIALNVGKNTAAVPLMMHEAARCGLEIEAGLVWQPLAKF